MHNQFFKYFLLIINIAQWYKNKKSNINCYNRIKNQATLFARKQMIIVMKKETGKYQKCQNRD